MPVSADGLGIVFGCLTIKLNLDAGSATALLATSPRHRIHWHYLPVRLHSRTASHQRLLSFSIPRLSIRTHSVQDVLSRSARSVITSVTTLTLSHVESVINHTQLLTTALALPTPKPNMYFHPVSSPHTSRQITRPSTNHGDCQN